MWVPNSFIFQGSSEEEEGASKTATKISTGQESLILHTASVQQHRKSGHRQDSSHRRHLQHGNNKTRKCTVRALLSHKEKENLPETVRMD